MMPGRAELALINRELAAAMAQRDEAQRLLDQWQGRESEMATVELQLAQLRAQRDHDRAARNDAGCLGEPPVDPPVPPYPDIPNGFIHRIDSIIRSSKSADASPRGLG